MMASITTSEAAARLGVSRSRVLALIAAGILKAHKLGRDWVIDEASLNAGAIVNRKPGRPKKQR